MSATFTGIPVEAFEFYEALAANNTRAWWAQHKSEYDAKVRQPLVALLSELQGEFGEGRVFRPHRDTRFAKDKTPIKEHQGGVVELEDAVAYYVQVSATGLMVAGGWYAPQGKQIHRFREAVDGPAGAELERVLRSLGKRFTIEGNALKTRPRGVDPDHPRLDLLRMRRVTAARDYPFAAWMGTRKALTTVRADWRALSPLMDWLADRVGPAEDPDF